MDFFKSVFTEDPDPPSPGSEPESSSPPEDKPPPPTDGGWTFGGLVKSLATRSESVIETYRRDLEEFGSGLKKETVTLREVANRAVKDLPSSIEISKSKAQGAFTSIADIIAHGKDTLLASDLDSSNLSANSVGSARYSRADAQLRAIQCDVNTYVDDPEDVDDYNKWKLGFRLGDKGEEIEDLMRDNGALGGIYKRVVPDKVDHEGFWCRYYYRVHRLHQAETVRANLVKRAISIEDEEELSWDVDDDEEEEEEKVIDSSKNATDLPLNKDEGGHASGVSVKEAVSDNVNADRKVEESSDSVLDEKNATDVVESTRDELLSVEKSDKEASPEVRAEASQSGKEVDCEVVSKQSSPEEEDLGWDEIEDLGSDDDDKIVAPSGDNSNRADLRKRLSIAEDDEDLSWDIEDNDEPIKS